jgi:DNA-binding IscR family transcriptional regulator
MEGTLLKKNSKNITVTEIIEALDGPISLTSCVDKSDSFCQSSDICFLGGKWNRVNEIIRNSLNDISLDDLLNFDNSFAIEHEKSRLKNIN